MSEAKTCPKCGAQLPENAPAGICPACLMQAGLPGESAAEPSPELRPTTITSGFVPPEPEELAKHFPQLEILELLGKGGMGAVYKARQIALDRFVAVKILPPEVGADPAFAERFTREARALAKLSHQNIVSVFDFGQTDGQYYFLMEFVDGANLRQLIQAGELQPEEALAIVPQICEALQFAHNEGIVHRDIKPENILVDKQGRVKIADFGLAKLLGKPPEEFTLTGTHQVMGTLHYMAPEQMRGAGSVDHRADIYSLGVVFYELLTGQLPIGRFEPPSRKVKVDVRLDEVVLRSLESEPDRRYQHVGDVRSEIERISRSHPPVDSIFPSPGQTSVERDSKVEELEQVVLQHFPDGKLAAVIAFREQAGVGLSEALRAVEAIALKHDIELPTASWPWHVLACAILAVLAGILLSAGWMFSRLDLNPIISGSVMFLLVAIVGVQAWTNRGTRQGLIQAWSLEVLCFLFVGCPLLIFLADPEPGLEWFYRVSGVSRGRDDAAFFRTLFIGLIIALLGYLISWLRKSRATREKPQTDEHVTNRGSVESMPRFSRFAIAGAVWALFGVLTVIPVLYFIGLNRVWNGTALPTDVIHSEPPIAFSIFMGTLLAIGSGAPIGTTIFGAVSIGHIKRSDGKLLGLRLAQLDLMFAPMLLLAAVTGFAGTLISLMLFKDTSMEESTIQLLMALIALPIWLYAARGLWRYVVGPRDAFAMGRIPLVGNESLTGKAALVLAAAAIVAHARPWEGTKPYDMDAFSNFYLIDAAQSLWLLVLSIGVALFASAATLARPVKTILRVGSVIAALAALVIQVQFYYSLGEYEAGHRYPQMGLYVTMALTGLAILFLVLRFLDERSLPSLALQAESQHPAEARGGTGAQQ